MRAELNLQKMKKREDNVVYTLTANCQDCYRCVRVCPVKAIRVSDGQACIEEDLCIKCGTCVRECPQHAKTIRTSLSLVKEMISSGKMIAASVAPSFPAFFDGGRSTRLPSALKKLGFHYISETAEGAKLITEESFKATTRGIICTACPTVVDYIEKYRPEYLDKLIPVASPMVAHGRLLKKRLGQDWAVVFIGPCAAKKQEACREENADAIDAVLTFTELIQWLEEEGIDISNCEESGFESHGMLDSARLFPLQGGMLKTGSVDCDGTNASVLHVSGAEDVIELFDIPSEEWNYNYVEPLFCSGGCINGPGVFSERNIFLRKQDVIAYAEMASKHKGKEMNKGISCDTTFCEFPLDPFALEISESRINDILEKTGKSNPELQLNCGACGYRSCRDNAIAVDKGMAEPEMCMPYMRRLAHQRTDKIIETSPNGVVVLDSMLNIINMNPAFQKMFLCNNIILGRRISYLLDADSYEKLVVGAAEQQESIRSNYGVKYHELVYALRSEGQYVGIYTDLTKVKFDHSQIDLIRNQTLEHARELLHHQISFSQEMAHYLGKSTAQSEEMVKRIMDLFEQKDFL